MHDATTMLKIRPQRERRAANDLRRHRIAAENWIEKRRRRDQRGGRMPLIERPLAPGYIGADAHPDAILIEARAIEAETQRRDITGCLGIARDRELVVLRERNGKEIDETPPSPAKPKVGDVVTVRQGHYAGLQVKVVVLMGKRFAAHLNGMTILLPYTHLHPG